MDKASDRIEAQSDASAELLLTSHGQGGGGVGPPKGDGVGPP